MTDSSSYAHVPSPAGPAPDVVDVMNRFLNLVDQAIIQGCVIVHLLSVARGHVEAQEYVASETEKPWHELISQLHAVERRANELKREHQLRAHGVDHVG